MENGLKYLLSAAVLAGAMSCVNNHVDIEIEEPTKETTQNITFTAYAGEDIEPEVKTTLHINGLSVHWDNEDKIMVFSNSAKKGVVSESANVQYNRKRAEFNVKTTLSNTYYAIYPTYSNAEFNTESNTIVANLATKQTAVGGSFSNGINLAIAKSEEDHLQFRNVGAILAVRNPSNYAGSIKIVSRDESVKMTGEGTVSYNEGDPVVVSSDNGVNYVEFTGDMSMKKDQIFNAVVYPGNYASGFDIIITSKNAPYAKAVYSSTKPLELNRNDNYMLFELPDGKFAWNSIAGPTNVNAVASGTWKAADVSWQWDYTINSGDTDSRAGYVVYVRKSGTTEYAQTISISDKNTYSTTVNGLDVDSYYDFGVQVTKTSGKPSEIIWKNNVWINGVRCIPPTPLIIEQISETRTTLTWKDNTYSEKNYKIWKTDIFNGTSVTNTAIIGENATTYETGVEAGHTYKFGIQALHKNSTEEDTSQDSEIVYFDPFVAMTWEELLYVNMDGNECLKPENVKITMTGQQATISWDCYSSAATGFNVFIREEGENWSKQLCAEKGKDDKSHTFYRQIEYGRTYYLGVQSVNSASISRNSDIVEKKVLLIEPTTQLFDWEQNRTAVPTWSDMTLCYGGDLWRVPTYWDKNRFASHALYTDQNGQEHYLFDAFLALEFSMKGYTLNYDDSGNKSARKEEWTALMDYWFDETYGFQALDDCIADAAKRIGEPKTKRYVIFVLPDPIYCETYTDKSSSTKYWGTYDDGSQADFSTADGRIKAYKWMIDQVRAKFASKEYKYIELAGFYILQETLSASYNNKYKYWKTMLQEVSDYCHKYHEGLYWIPYGYRVNKTGYTYDSGHNTAIQNWKSDYGFDLAILQPNMYWDYKEGRSWYTTCETYIKGYNMGMEIEFEGSHGENLATSSSILDYRKDGTKNTEAYNNRERLRRYFENAKKYDIYGKKPLVLYSGTDAMNELATSTAEKDRIIYHELCQFIINSPLKESNSQTSTPNFNYGGSLN